MENVERMDFPFMTMIDLLLLMLIDNQQRIVDCLKLSLIFNAGLMIAQGLVLDIGG